MFDKVDWEKIVNELLPLIDEWKVLILKIYISDVAMIWKIYYSKNGTDFIDLDDEVEFDDPGLVSFEWVFLDETGKIAGSLPEGEATLLTMIVKDTGEIKINHWESNQFEQMTSDEIDRLLEIDKNDLSNI